MVDKIAQKIISDLSSQNLGIGEGEGLMIIKGLYHCLDPVVYSKVFDSITMKVNLTSFSNVCLFDAINESNFPMEALKDILDPKDLLSKLSAELIALAPDQYRSQHFKALRRIASDEFPSVRFDALDLNPLLLAAIKGLDAYRATTHTNPSGTVITTFKDTAEQDVKQLLRAALPHMKIDYSSFTSLTSDSKVFMAANGFEIKRIKGATRHDRGRMLYEQLGL
jgi:hypothetical protein